MGAPTSLLGQVRAFARDFPRDRMPPGYLWDIADYVPALMDATLTGRGGWLWGSTVLNGFEAQNGILATFSTGDRLIVAAAATLGEHGRFYEVSQDAPYTASDFGPAAPCLQNLVQLGDEVISVEEDGLDGPQVITVNDDNTLRITGAWVDEHPPRRAVVYKSMLVTAAARPPLAALEELRTVRFSVPVEKLLDATKGQNQESAVISGVGSTARAATKLAADASAGDTNIKVVSAADMVVGERVAVSVGLPSVEYMTISTVGTAAGAATKLAADAAAGDTKIKVASVADMVVGERVAVGIGLPSVEHRTITDVGTAGKTGTGVTLDAALSSAHASGTSAQDLGGGVTFSTALTRAHASGSPAQDLGGGVTFSTALTRAHASGATVIATGGGTTSLVAPTAVGATKIELPSVDGFSVGMTVQVDTGQNLNSYDTNSFIRTSHEVTGLAALRTMLIVFHRGSTERIRGATAPRTPPVPLPADDKTDYTGDMWLEPLFDDLGCLEPKTIAYYNDSVLFANERGLYLTDGATVTNLASEGGIRSYWRQMYTNHNTLAGAVFLDYYILTVTRSDGTDITLVCDIPRRQWFRFTNVPALTYISSKSTANVERLWAGLKGTHRLARIGPCFFPDLDVALLSDDNGVPVLPSFETPWYRLAEEGRKRVRFAYLSYDARLPATTPTLEIDYLISPQGAYASAGSLPATDEYSRFRIPVGKFPYGVAFRVKQLQATRALRIFDLGVETQAGERSRV